MTSVSTCSTTAQNTQSSDHLLSAAKGGGVVFAGRLFQLTMRAVFGIVLARVLGAEQYGLCNLAMTAAAVASGISTLGLEQAVVHFVSRFASRRDTARLRGTLQIGLGLPVAISLVAAIAMFALAGPLSRQVFHEPRLAPLLRITSLVVPFESVGYVATAAMQGFQKMKHGVIAQDVSQSLVRLVLVAVLVAMASLTATTSLASYVAAMAVSCIMLFVFLNRLSSLKRPWDSARRDVKSMLGFALPVYLSTLIGTFGTNLRTLLLGAASTAVDVGIFAVASQINMVGRTFHGAIVTTSAPIISALHDCGDVDQLRRFYQAMTKWTFAVNLPLFLVMLLLPAQILSIFGQDFAGGATALVILACANLANTGTGICGLVVDMTGHTRLKLANSILAFVLSLVLSIVCIPQWGLVGAAIASLSTTATLNALRMIEVYVLYKILPYNRDFLKPVAAGLASLAIAWGIGRVGSEWPTLFRTIGRAGALIVTYVGVILSLGLSTEDRNLLARILRRLIPPSLVHRPLITGEDK